MASQTSRKSLYKYVKGEEYVTSGNLPGHNDTVDEVDALIPLQLLDSGTFTLSGGSSPAANQTLTGISTTETEAPGRVVLNVDSATSHSNDYGYNWDFETMYDQSAGEWDVTITVNWDTDPGAGNDVSVSYRVYEE